MPLNENSDNDTYTTEGQRSNDSMKEFKSRILRRQDVLVWICGVCFIGLMSAMISVAGERAGWNDPLPYKNDDNNSRFSPEPEFCNETDVKGRHGYRCAGRWYYWKLPIEEVTALTRAVVWICYSSHQIILWIGIYISQTNKDADSTLNTPGANENYKLKNYNWFLLITNLVFFLVHLGQTHWTYDGLAQDVALASSEGSVIMILALILFMEWKTRGIAFMLPSNDSRLRVSKPVLLARKYHGYLISWAITYTFWYHPMENTVGHILGFIHAGMILLQGSLVNTKFHLNRYWRLLIECWVIVHGCFISYETRSPTTYRQQWPLYFLGFGLILACTQIFGLRIWQKLHYIFRIVPLIIFLVISILLSQFGVIRGSTREESNFSKLKEMFYIPLEMYLLTFSLWIFLFLWLKLEKCDAKTDDEKVLGVTEAASPDFVDNPPHLDRNTQNCDRNKYTFVPKASSRNVRRVIGIGGFLAVHAFMITVSYLLHWADLNMSNTSLMFIFVAVFSLCWSVAIMTLKLAAVDR